MPSTNNTPPNTKPTRTRQLHPHFNNLEEIRAHIDQTAPRSPLTTDNGCSEQVFVYTMLAWKHAISLEVNTGLRHSRGSVLKTINQHFGVSFGTKRKAYDFMEQTCKVITDPIISDPA